MAKRRRTTRRAVKRSAKRSAKRGAYKSRKTHLKSRGRTQRGGQGWKEKLEAAAREKAEAAAAAAAALREKTAALQKEGQDFITKKTSDFSTGSTVIEVGVAIANIIPKIFNAVFSLMVMVYILSTIARNPRAFAGAAKEELIKKLADLKKRMEELPGLKDCINIFESKIQTQETMNPPSSPPPESNVGKTCIYSPGIGSLSYQALIVGEWDQAKAKEYDYDKPQYLIWVNGGGLDPEYVSKDREDIIKIVSNEKDEGEFNKLEGNRIGQQNVTMQQAREYYSLTSESLEPTDGPAPPIILPEQQETIVDMLKRRATEFSKATDKKQFIVGAVNGYIAASKLMLERFTERVQDKQLKDCIQSIKEALTQQIKSQVAELKRKLSGIGGDSEEIQTVFKQITALGQGLRDQFGALNKRTEELQGTISTFLTDKTNKLSSSFGLPSVSLRP